MPRKRKHAEWFDRLSLKLCIYNRLPTLNIFGISLSPSSPGPAVNFEALHSAIESPALKAVAAHWQAARNGAQMPSWQRLRPSQIAPQLSIIWAYKFDRIGRQFTGRLAGERISECFGKNFRGTRLQDIHPQHGFEISHAAMSRVALTPAVYLCRGPLFRYMGRVTSGERIMLPLASDGRNSDGILGASYYQKPPIVGTGAPVEVISDNEVWTALA